MALDMSKLNELAVSPAGFIFDPATGHIYTSNPIGVEIINAFREGKTKSEIKEIILGEYAMDEHSVEKDLLDFIAQMINYGLLKDV